MQAPSESGSRLSRNTSSSLNLIESLESRTLFSASLVDHLVFLSQLSSPGINKPLTHFKVLVEDAGNNTLTKDHTPVTISLATGPSNGTLSGTLTVKPKNGIASFNNVILKNSGNFTLTATDGNVHAVSNAFVISPIVPTKLKIISVFPPNNFPPINGQLGPVTIHVLDADGHIATNFNSGSAISNGTSNGSSNATVAATITLVLTSTLSTEATLGTPSNVLTITQDATAGVAVFPTSALTIQPKGWYLLTVSAGNLTAPTMQVYIP